MKEINLNSKQYLLVEVPDDSNESEIDENLLNVYDIKSELIFTLQLKNFNNYKIIGKISNILEDEMICRVLVECEGTINYYRNYLSEFKSNNLFAYTKQTATDSFLSWLESIDLDLKKEYLFIKKI